MARVQISVYDKRRAHLFKELPDNTLVVVPGSKVLVRNADTEYPFRPDSTLHFLTGYSEPAGLLVMKTKGKVKRSILFVQPKDPVLEVWTGRRISPEEAVQRYGVNEAFTIDKLDEKVGELIKDVDHVAYELGRDLELDKQLIALARRHWFKPRLFSTGPNTWLDLADKMSELRLVKDPHDVKLLRRAAHATVQGHIVGMRSVSPGINESQLQGAVEFGFRAYGGHGTSFNTIAAGGNNANVLHYDSNRGTLMDGDLVLVDAGCEIDCMAADVTRTYPVSGIFSTPQADLYDLVLEAQLAAIEKIKPGSSQDVAHEASVKVISRGLHDLGFFHQGKDEIIEKELYKRYFPHRTGHWLGLDVHDTGRYKAGDKPRPLEPGMALTIEPGLYVRADDVEAPDYFRGIGIRIEDDLLVTKKGHQILTAACPKTRKQIEAAMKEAGPLELPVISYSD